MESIPRWRIPFHAQDCRSSRRCALCEPKSRLYKLYYFSTGWPAICGTVVPGEWTNGRNRTGGGIAP
jgi:hypothetical protein